MSNNRILELLAQGVHPTQVLSVVGCSAAYLTSLVKDPEFAAVLEARRAEYFSEANEEEVVLNKHLALEHKLLKRVADLAESAEMRDVIRALEVVSNRQDKAKSRTAGVNAGNQVVYQTVNLNLPTHAIPEYTLNANKEVVAIDNKIMTPMTGMQVKELFNSIQTREQVVQAL